ncbi:MAG: accessory factor UbiK family protein [Maricaulaceae bacterium]|jgi:BMFP domain-containing protein YqiC
MQTKSPMFDDLAQLMTNAMGVAHGMGEEFQTLLRAQMERFIADMDLVPREELEVMKDRADAADEKVAALEERLAALEAKLADE